MAVIRVHIVGIKNVKAVIRLIKSMDIDLEIDRGVQITVCNNGSPGDYDNLMIFNNVDIWDCGNIGIAPAWNMGIRAALNDKGCEAIVLIPNDGFFDKGAFKEGLDFFFEHNPRVIVSYPHRLKDNSFHPGSIHIDSCIYPTDVFREVGMFDPSFKLCWYEDADMLHRLNEAKIPIKVHPTAAYNNFPGGNRSIVIKEGILTKGDLLKYRLMNQLYYLDKWKEKLNHGQYEKEKAKLVKNLIDYTSTLL